jgi:ribosomal protein S10
MCCFPSIMVSILFVIHISHSNMKIGFAARYFCIEICYIPFSLPCVAFKVLVRKRTEHTGDTETCYEFCIYQRLMCLESYIISYAFLYKC